jgi:SlyX protein
MNESTLEIIETKIAYLERANAELSDVVFRQQREIQALGEALERMRSAAGDERPAGTQEERPPHY